MYNNNNYNGNNFRAPFTNQPQYGPQQQQFKKSGAIYSKIRKGNKEGFWIVNAWRKTQNGLMKAVCSPIGEYDKSGNFQGITTHVGREKGHEFIRYKVEITNSSAGTHQKFYCLMRLDTKVIVIQELGLCITPNGSGFTKSGKKVTGYFGANYKRR